MGGWKISGRMEKWEHRKDFVFSHVCVGWRSGKMRGWKTFLFGWREKGKDGKCNLYKLTIMSLLFNSGKVRGVGKCNKVGVFV